MSISMHSFLKDNLCTTFPSVIIEDVEGQLVHHFSKCDYRRCCRVLHVEVAYILACVEQFLIHTNESSSFGVYTQLT